MPVVHFVIRAHVSGLYLCPEKSKDGEFVVRPGFYEFERVYHCKTYGEAVTKPNIFEFEVGFSSLLGSKAW